MVVSRLVSPKYKVGVETYGSTDVLEKTKANEGLRAHITEQDYTKSVRNSK